MNGFECMRKHGHGVMHLLSVGYDISPAKSYTVHSAFASVAYGAAASSSPAEPVPSSESSPSIMTLKTIAKAKMAANNRMIKYLMPSTMLTIMVMRKPKEDNALEWWWSCILEHRERKTIETEEREWQVLHPEHIN